jgi:hypothetical protein
MRVCGQWFDGALRERISACAAEQPGLSRSALAARVCDWLDWTDARGRPRLGSARRALAALARSGALTLPAARPRPAGPVHGGDETLAPVALALLCAELAELGPIELIQVASAEQRRLYRQLMTHHPLGDAPLCGAQLRYLFRCSRGLLGATAFQSASFALKARDLWIGWSENTRRAQLGRIVANARFLILPTVTVPHLASHLLGRLARQLPGDWQARYGERPLLLETFVHPDYDGTCYKAAGWTCIGGSAGRRDGVAKAVWVRPLVEDARQQLCQGPTALPRERPGHAADWAEQEFGGLKAWDARLKTRLYHLARDFWGHAQSRSLSRRCAQRAATVAAYRFFQNPRINMPILLDAHRQAVIDRMRAHSVVLVPQDTTSLNYTAHPGTEGLGPIGTKLDGGPQGLILHNSHAFTPDGVPLGVVSAESWARDPEAHGSRRERDERESRKWLDAYQTLQEIAPQLPDTTLVSIGDREADLFELFDLARAPDSPRLLVRASKGRRRQVVDADGLTPLWASLEALDSAGQLDLKLPRRGARPARTARLDVRYAPVTIAPPRTLKTKAIELWAVLISEAEAPDGVEPVDWLLLTNVATTTLDEALERVRWYSARWGIEVFHRILKTGCQIEDRQLGFVARLENCLAIDLVVAWRIYHLTMLGRMDPDAPCTVFFSEPEWKALYAWHHSTREVPSTPPSLKEATRWIAIKGGFQARKADGDPGAEVLWHGLQKLDVAVEMYLVFQPEQRPLLRDEYPPWYRRRPEDTS